MAAWRSPPGGRSITLAGSGGPGLPRAGATLAGVLLGAAPAGSGGCSEPLGAPGIDTAASAGTPLSGGADYVTGGGYICGNVELGTTGVKTNFGFEAGNKANGLGGN